MEVTSLCRSISSRIGEENPSNTIAEQNERIARYLKKRGCSVSEKYSDRKRTAEATEGFDKLVQDGMARKFDAVVVDSIFRCGRTLPFAIEALQRTFYPLGIQFAVVEDRFHFTPEDFYVFVIAHAYKHYSRSGTGIRTLADIYIMNQKLGGTLNWEYVDSELRGLGIFSYERESRELAQKLFGIAELPTEANLSEAEQQMLAYYLGASTYGTIENRILNQMQKLQPDDGAFTARTKRKYLLSRIFPGREWCKAYAPTVYKYPVLLPFFWVWRLIYKGITNRKKVTQEIKTIKAGKQN